MAENFGRRKAETRTGKDLEEGAECRKMQHEGEISWEKIPKGQNYNRMK
jgi:hypothetical protein